MVKIVAIVFSSLDRIDLMQQSLDCPEKVFRDKFIDISIGRRIVAEIKCLDDEVLPQ